MKTALPLWRVTIPMMTSVYVNYSNIITTILLLDLLIYCITMLWCIELDISTNQPVTNVLLLIYYV